MLAVSTAQRREEGKTDSHKGLKEGMALIEGAAALYERAAGCVELCAFPSLEGFQGCIQLRCIGRECTAVRYACYLPLQVAFTELQSC